MIEDANDYIFVTVTVFIDDETVYILNRHLATPDDEGEGYFELPRPLWR